MFSAKEIIEYNLKADFEVLSDYIFYCVDRFYLGAPLKKDYRPKIISSDQDGVWEELGTPQLCELILEELGEENTGINQNLECMKEVYSKPVDIQKKEMLEIYKANRVNPKQIIRANERASRKFRFSKNSSILVSKLQKIGYHLVLYSGSFKQLIVQTNDHPEKYPLALELVWNKMNLPEKQINGSTIYCDRNGNVVDIDIMIEQRKREERSKKSTEFGYDIMFTDDIVSDAPRMDVCIDTLPITFALKETLDEELPSGITILCPEARKDKLKLLNPIHKTERGLMQYLGMKKEEIVESKNTAKEIKKLFSEKKYLSEKDFLSFKDLYVDNSFRFLGLLTLKFRAGEYSLFPEKITNIRENLKILKNIKDFERGKKLIEKTFNILQKYSAEFH